MRKSESGEEQRGISRVWKTPEEEKEFKVELAYTGGIVLAQVMLDETIQVIPQLHMFNFLSRIQNMLEKGCPLFVVEQELERYVDTIAMRKAEQMVKIEREKERLKIFSVKEPART